jgi:hypothetical protein
MVFQMKTLVENRSFSRITYKSLETNVITISFRTEFLFMIVAFMLN